MDEVTLPPLKKRNIVLEVKRSRQCGVLPVNARHKREVNLVLEALPGLPNETSGFPSMATERAILKAIDNIPEMDVKRSYKVYTVQERRAGLIARVIDGKSAEYVLREYGVSIRTQGRDMKTIRELHGLNTKEFNTFRSDPTNHSMLREAIMELDYSPSGPNGSLHSNMNRDILAMKPPG